MRMRIVTEGAAQTPSFFPSPKIDACPTFSPPPRQATLRASFQFSLYDGPHGPDQSA